MAGRGRVVLRGDFYLEPCARHSLKEVVPAVPSIPRPGAWTSRPAIPQETP